MSIQKLIKEALAKSPLGVKAALEEELRVRVAEAVSDKMSATDLEEEIKDGDKVSWHDPSVGKNVTGVVTMASGMKRKGIKHAQVRIDNSHGTTTKVPHSQLKKIDEEAEQIDEISTDLKKRYVEKGAEDVVDRFTGRGKYERPRNPAHFTKTGRVKKSALNRPEAIKYREKLDNRRDIVNKVSQEVHGKKRFGEEVEQIDEAKAIHEYDWPESALHRGASLGDHAQDAIRHNMHAHDAIGHVYSAADAEGRKWVNKHHDDLLKTFKSHGLQTEEVEQIDEGLDFQNKTSRSGASTTHIYHNGKHLGTIAKHFTKSNPNGSYRIQYNSDTIPVGSKGLHAHEGLPSQEAAKKLVSKHVNESLEQIDELDRKTLHNYLNKALNDLTSINTARKITSNDKSPEDIKHRNDLTRKAVNRKKGFSRAYDRLTKEEVELEEALKIGSKVRIHAPGKDYHGKVGYVGEIRKRTYGTMAPSYTVDYREPGEDYNRSISLSREKIKLHKEEVELDEAAGMVKDGYYVTNQKDGNITHDKPFQDSKYAISHANRGENKTGYVHRVHKVKNGKIDKQWEYNGGHMDGGWEHFSDFKGDDARGHMRNIPKHFLHGND